MPTEKDLKIAKAIKKELKSKLGDKLISVTLYGSRARGTAKKDSDMDLLIIINQNNKSLENAIDKVIYDYEYNNNFQISVSPIVYSKSDYQKRINPPTSFIYTIQKEMIKI